jgi:enhancing lycopene biosynthesis protein 2
LERCDVDKIAIDDKNNIITTPAYMKNTSPYSVYVGIDKMISETIKRIKH